MSSHQPHEMHQIPSTSRTSTSTSITPVDIPQPPPGFRWHHGCILVDHEQPDLDYVHDPRLLPHFRSANWEFLINRPTVHPYIDAFREANRALAEALKVNNLEHLVESYGVSRQPSDRGGASFDGPAVFIVYMREDQIHQWRKIDGLVRDIVAGVFTREIALGLASFKYPQYVLPIRYWYQE